MAVCVCIQSKIVICVSINCVQFHFLQNAGEKSIKSNIEISPVCDIKIKNGKKIMPV